MYPDELQCLQTKAKKEEMLIFVQVAYNYTKEILSDMFEIRVAVTKAKSVISRREVTQIRRIRTAQSIQVGKPLRKPTW